jgi:uncharacterized Zn finger protein
MCKHVAAALYGVGARLDESPELLFKLRAVEAAELLGNFGNALPAAKAPTALAGADLAALFGLEMADEEPPPPKPARKTATRLPAATARPAAKTSTKPAVKTKPAKITVKAKPKPSAPRSTAKQATAASKPVSKPKKAAKEPVSKSLAKPRAKKVEVKTISVRKARKK